MKFSTHGLIRVALVAGLGLVAIARLQARAESSLTDLDIEYTELKVTLEKILGEKEELSTALADTRKMLADMRQSLSAASAETEVFKRRSMELTLRMEALGLDLAGANIAKLEQRLLTAVSDLRSITVEKKFLSQALIRLSDAAADYARSTNGAPADARVTLESEIRNANQALGLQSSSAAGSASVTAKITDAVAISVKEDLSLVVINLGSRHGVKVGMPLRVMRNESVIGSVQVVDVRERFSGAIIQNLSSEREQIKAGDRLVVDARQ